MNDYVMFHICFALALKIHSKIAEKCHLFCDFYQVTSDVNICIFILQTQSLETQTLPRFQELCYKNLCRCLNV